MTTGTERTTRSPAGQSNIATEFHGESIVENVAGVEGYRVAHDTFRAACERWPGTPITLRQGARVIENSRRLRVVSQGRLARN